MKNKGFTLIELLAVITIMGILMLVAIPAVSRTIENSRRDTFADIAHNYLNAVRNAVLADNIQCGNGAEKVNASATSDGTYYFVIDTQGDAQAMKDLMESGGKSPFGNSELKGYVKWVKTTDKGDDGSNKKTVTKYSMLLVDSGSHGFDDELQESNIKRSKISTKTSKNTASKDLIPATSDWTQCELS